ncbi:gamma-aminobutyric acid receptor alpha-like [Periplaneta americana]|uniref:GABA-receptor like cys-loop ligand-gated ion channel subunit n=1 Tax=Periplaneta americana TaxID=6978 RepID=A0A7T5Y188_PERAM|nr:GABA-receptor like cys-loop ligand-gated ion channel subunit [Periplaneta americana]
MKTSSLALLSAALLIFLASIDLLATFALQPSGALQTQQFNNHRNISELLDNLLRGYDNSVRPDFGGPPAIIEVDIMVRSMGPISEVDMTYSMDCYFRQSWVDRRLAFQGNKETLALSISMLKRIWKPDTYFYNGKQSYLHTITTPNKFVRLYQDGRVLYSSRLTIKAGCPMNLEDFPMDTQRCPLKFGSFGYTTNDVVYRWNKARQVAIAEDMKLSQFDLIATPSANQTDVLQSGSSDVALCTICEYSMLLVSFHLQRHMGNFLIQVYGPCVLLVVLSWVSFWLNREATADRVSLGITTVLTMTFLGLEARTDLPKVPYPTALDFFVFLSFAFIFATIIQFAVVHYFTKYGSGECYFSSDFSSDSSSDEEEWNQGGRRRTEAGEHTAGRKASGGSGAGRRADYSSPNGDTGTSSHLLEVIPLSACSITPSPSTISGRAAHQPWSMPSCLGCATGSDTARDEGSAGSSPYTPAVGTSTVHRLSVQGQMRRKRKKRTPRYNSVSKIDRASRIVFPLCFLAINVFYWYAYLSRSKRIHQMRTGESS